MPEPTAHRAGFAALIGAPNVGKSSLMNALMSFPLAAVSAKPQTTRENLLGILNGTGFQLCLVDTPGWLEKAQDGLQDSLIRAAKAAARQDADVLIYVVEPKIPDALALSRAGILAALGKPVVVVVNKSDCARDPDSLMDVAKAFEPSLKAASKNVVSAKTGKGLKGLLKTLTELIPESPPYYSNDRLSDRWERWFAGEIIRGQIFERFHEEVPHACAVTIEQFREEKGRPDRVLATIHVERPTQKGILVGKGGQAIQGLRIASHKALESFLGRKADLELFVKVSPNWRKNPKALKEFGYL